MNFNIKDKYLLLLAGGGINYVPSLPLYVVQALVLIMEFASSIAIGLHFYGFSHMPGIVLISTVSAATCLYTWRLSMWGGRSSLWWLMGPGMVVLCVSLVGALLGIRFQSDDDFVSVSWHADYMFTKSLWGIYIVAWGIIRTVLIELIQRSRKQK